MPSGSLPAAQIGLASCVKPVQVQTHCVAQDRISLPLINIMANSTLIILPSLDYYKSTENLLIYSCFLIYLAMFFWKFYITFLSNNNIIKHQTKYKRKTDTE